MYDASKIIDLTGQQPNPPSTTPKQKHLIRGGKVVVRRPEDIDSIVVHQTAVDFGASRQQIAAAGGDPILAEHRRALNVAAHMTAFTTGFAVHANPFLWYVWHGNGFNRHSLGLEIDGLYSGLKDDPNTVPREDAQTTAGGGHAQPLTDATCNAARQALAYMVEKGAQQGIHIKYVLAHRQSSGTRRPDPGQEIWERVVLDFAVKTLGLQTKPDMLIDDGYSIPREWQPGARGRYNDPPGKKV